MYGQTEAADHPKPHQSLHHRLPPPLAPPRPTALIVVAVAVAVVRGLTSSIFALPRLMPGTTHAPQLQRMPCHAYLPTLVLHFGHSRRPSRAPRSSSGRIQERGSRKRWAHCWGDDGAEEGGERVEIGA